MSVLPSVSSAQSFPNVVEVLDEDPVLPNLVQQTEKDRIAHLEHTVEEQGRKIALLTEAVIMFLNMKSKSEHTIVSRCKLTLSSYETNPTVFSGTGGGLSRPSGPYFTDQWGTGTPSVIKLTGDASQVKAEWVESFEKLQTDAAKTDSLILALKE